MAEVTRINVKQKDGSQKQVSFLSDIKLNTVAEGNLIKVTTNTDSKTATVSVDNAKLSLENGKVKVNTPLEFTAQTTIPTETTGLRAVSSGGTTKLYWGSNVIEAHDPEEGYVTNADFLAHTGNEATDVNHVTDVQRAALEGIQSGERVVSDITFDTTIISIESDIRALEDVTNGYAGERAIKTAVDAVDAKVDTVDAKADGTLEIIGAWTTISDKTVKKAIEDNKAAIEVNTAEITALKGNHFIVVDTLPATGEPNCIYLIPKAGTETGNIKEEWIYVNNAWEKIGDTAVDLTEYAKTTEVQALVTAEATTRANADTALDGRLTTAEGKLTTVEGKLADLPEGKTIEQAIEEAVGAEETRAMGVESGLDTRLSTAETNIGTLSTLTTDAKNNLVAAVNEVDAHANTAQTTADSALATASTAVQTASGDGNIDAAVSDTALSVGVKTGSTLADILSVCTISFEEE